jgi:hypothetical protein
VHEPESAVLQLDGRRRDDGEELLVRQLVFQGEDQHGHSSDLEVENGQVRLS